MSNFKGWDAEAIKNLKLKVDWQEESDPIKADALRQETKKILNKLSKAKKEKSQPKSRKIKTDDYESLKKKCNVLWAEIIKLRANKRSEYSGKTKYLQSHHLAGKASIFLRYLLDNGYCCTSYEHKWGFHSTNVAQARKYQDKVEEQRGKAFYDKLHEMDKQNTSVSDIRIIYEFLKREREKYGRL